MEFEQLSKRYTGNRAFGYDRERLGGEKWEREQEVMRRLLSQLSSGSTVVDIPVGTCRFVEFYKTYGLQVTGMDISEDMLASAAAKARACAMDLRLRKGDIRSIDAPDGAFDTVVCVRFLNWVDAEGLSRAFSELVRVAHRRLIVGVRTSVPREERRWVSLEGARKLPRYLVYRLRNAGRKSGLVYHQRPQVQELFARHSLQVEERCLVEERCDWTEYHIYLLSKGAA